MHNSSSRKMFWQKSNTPLKMSSKKMLNVLLYDKRNFTKTLNCKTFKKDVITFRNVFFVKTISIPPCGCGVMCSSCDIVC
ncbi:hypothetical protein ZOSMA_197G00180 [Zostera marina]|uniref:Uncharacterized protein n=1 Tax=Zostera marina TaxID=29655 RepID=A0A0K9PQZ9_ZOSMR|nr:hypothetical protein ZOSMA_197G00180 [Zostera marina]